MITFLIVLITFIGSITFLFFASGLFEILNIKLKSDTIKLRHDVKELLHDDIHRMWTKFFDSYLYVYVDSKMVPNEKEFKEFRKSYIKMFTIGIGLKQCDLYYKIYGGQEYFNLFLEFEFEKMFKEQFIRLISENVLGRKYNK